MSTPDKDTYEGVINITRNGTGFFSRGEGKDDLVIMREHLGTALPYDVVKVVSIGKVEDPKTRKRREAGKVVEVVTRAREVFVGTVVQEGKLALLLPDWKRMYTPLVVKGAEVPPGHKVVLRMKGWDPRQEFPWGEVEEIIGPAGLHETEMRAVVLAQGFSPDFPPGVVAEATELEQRGEEKLTEGIAGRRDFRPTTTFTIDPSDAKDFDDALSVKFLENGNVEVGIHIADVSYFVTPGTAIDREARHRATSVYLVDRTIPMLPHVLSTNLCSLNPNVDRLAMSAVFVLDTDARVVETWFGETVIHSDKRFTYEEAQRVLDEGSGTLYEELSTVRNLARKIRARRVLKGAIEFDTAEVKIEVDADGKPIRIRLKERLDTNLLIEDCMLLANEQVAGHMETLGKKHNIPHGVIYRVHDLPDAERVTDLAMFLRVLGYNLPVGPSGRVKGTDLNAVLEDVQGKPEEYLIKMATLRSMAKATYSTRNVGHYGLAFSHYTHFTSPIRRYPDLLVHRMLRHYLRNEPAPRKELEELEKLAIHSSEREIAATEAERDSIKMKQVEFLADKIGQEFSAVVSGVTDRGLYVEEQETRADGMIRISALGNDYFVYDEKRYRLVGERTKQAFALGDRVRVKLIATRIPERELDFELVHS